MTQKVVSYKLWGVASRAFGPTPKGIGEPNGWDDFVSAVAPWVCRSVVAAKARGCRGGWSEVSPLPDLSREIQTGVSGFGTQV